VKEDSLVDRRTVFGLLGGAAIGLGAWWSDRKDARAPRVALWLADRGAHQVVGLDRDLLYCVVLPVRAPVALAPAPMGGVWVVSAVRSWSGERQVEDFEWLRLDARARPIARGRLPGFRSLAAAEEGGVWALYREGRELVQWDREGQPVTRLRVETGAPLRCLVSTTSAWKLPPASSNAVLALREDSSVDLLVAKSWTVSTCLGSRVLDACAGETGWWVLTEGGLLALHEDLSVRAEFASPDKAAGLVAVWRGAGVWVLDESGTSVELVGGRRGWRERREWGLAGVAGGVELASGALLLTTPGALLVFDELGNPRAGQGGFDFLVDLIAVSSSVQPLARS